jgi:Lipoprotein LpqB beta-propeller domain/Sporulation and spore germination
VRRRNVSAVLVAAGLGLSLALTSCGGIPTSGPVNAGDPISDDANVNVAYRLLGPSKNATQQDILLGFVQAAVSADEDYAKARQFLSAGFSNTWKPNTVTQIRSGLGTTTRQSDSTLNYSISSSAFVDSAGRYFEAAPATQQLSFGFAKDSDGQWRISSAPPGIVLSQESFDTTFEQHALYFLDPSNNYLVPDVRWFPKTALVSTKIVTALLAGQADWLQQGVTHSEFPNGTALGSSVNIESGTAKVDLTEEALSASPEQRDLMRQQLTSSLGVSNVIMTVNNVAIDVSGSDANKAVSDPGDSSALLVRRDASFGFLADDNSITPIPKLSEKIVKLDPSAVTLSRTKVSAAALTKDGVYIVRTAEAQPRLLDRRSGLIAPSMDPFGIVWSVPAKHPGQLTAFESDGTGHRISAALPGGAHVHSFALARDGSRIFLLLSTNIGPQLIVYGVIRQDGIPVSLGEPNPLRVTSAEPVSATWVDDRTIAMIGKGGDQDTVTVFEVGGEQTSIGRVVGATQVVGGGGVSGLRVVNSNGSIYRSRGTGWQDIGVKVSFVATQQ